MAMTDETLSPALPWWRFKMLWLVVGGPAIVVVAAIGTAVIAFRGADPVVQMPAGSQAADADGLSTAPAMHARNHAATAATR
jgi:hypothetical protein